MLRSVTGRVRVRLRLLYNGGNRSLIAELRNDIAQLTRVSYLGEKRGGRAS